MSKIRSSNDGTNLIVNYLPQTVDEGELCKMFGECGVVESVKVIRDGKSQISRGFAFIKYQDRGAADKAIRKYSGYKMGRKTLRVSLSRPPGEDTRDTNLVIENIPDTMEDEEFHEMFSVYGTIITHKVLRTHEGEHRGKAYVRYNLKAEADDAITALNGVNIGAKDDLVVRFADPPTVRATPELLTKRRVVSQPYPLRPPNPRSVIRPPYLNPHLTMTRSTKPTKDSTDSHMDPYKTSSWLSGDDDREGYQHATAPWNSASAVPSDPVASGVPPVPSNKHSDSYDPEKGWCVFVYNLPPTANNETLYALFARFGAINTVKPIVDTEGICKGYGFVHMPIYEDACRSIQMLDGYQLNGKALQVRFKNSIK